MPQYRNIMPATIVEAQAFDGPESIAAGTAAPPGLPPFIVWRGDLIADPTGSLLFPHAGRPLVRLHPGDMIVHDDVHGGGAGILPCRLRRGVRALHPARPGAGRGRGRGRRHRRRRRAVGRRGP